MMAEMDSLTVTDLRPGLINYLRKVWYGAGLAVLGALLLSACQTPCDTPFENCKPLQGNACPLGSEIFRVSSGTYITSNTTILSDDCNTGMMPRDLDGMMAPVVNNADGSITVGAQGGTSYGTVYVRCNLGARNFDPAIASNGACNFTVRRSVTIHILKTDTMSLDVDEAWSGQMGACGTQPAICTLHYQFTIGK